jgi:hypothetical protein
MFTNPTPVSFWPLYTIYYSSKYMNLMKWQIKPRPVAPQPRPRACYKVHMFLLIHGFKSHRLPTHYQSCSGHYILSCKHESIDITDPTKTRPRPCYRVYLYFLIQAPKGWIQVHTFINPISDLFWPFLNKCYSCKHESDDITDQTKSRSTPTKTKTLLKSVCVLPKTYS